MVNVSFNNTPRAMEVSIDTAKDLIEESLTTNSLIASSGTITITGGANVTGRKIVQVLYQQLKV